MFALFPRYCTFQLARQGSWSSWTDWGPCDQKCTVIRERFCAAKDKSKCPGVDADGIQTQKKRCETEECNGRFKAGPGARFSKVPIINGPGKLSPFTLKTEVSIVLHLTR